MTGRSRRSDAGLPSNSAFNSHPGSLESQAVNTGTNYSISNSAATFDHRDGLGRVTQLTCDDCTRYGWYLDPDDAKLAELQVVQGTENMHSMLPWVIQMAAASYQSDGKGALHIRPFHYALACLVLPFLVSRAHT